MKHSNINGQIQCTGKKGNYLIQPIADNIFRCVYTLKEEFAEPSLLVNTSETFLPVSTEIFESKNDIQICSSKLKLSIDKNTEHFTWSALKPESASDFSSESESGQTLDSVSQPISNSTQDRLLLQEAGKELSETDVVRYTTGDEDPVIKRVKTVDGERNFILNLKAINDRKAYRAKLFFDFASDESIFGLGQAEEGIYDHRRQNQYLYQHNMRIPMPFMLSDKGYGIFVDCCSLMTFNDDVNGSYLFLDTVKQLDYYFIVGENADEIIASYRRLTGRASMLPKWAFGYIQSKERYKSDQELVDVAKHYRDLNVPLDCVVQDWYSWSEDHWGEKRVDPARYSNLKNCIDQIHEMNVHAMVSVWPNMNNGTIDHTEFMEKGFLLNDLCTYDAFNEEARELYWKQAEIELFNSGFDSWWCDSTEPFSGPDWNGPVKREPWERYSIVGGEHKHFLDPEFANVYSLLHAKGIYENQRKATDQKRVLNLTRSGYASSQKYGAVLWSGDITATWETMRRQIAEGLNMSMSGYPYWTLDIGAFFTVKEKWQNRGCCCENDPEPKWFWQGDFEEGIRDKGYQELYTRWLQFGVFLPMFRSHGTDTPREIWNFGKEGEPVYDTLKKYIQLRYRLMPYIYSLAGAVHFNHYTMMRSLLFDFAQDPEAVKQSSEYMFGPSFLVSPVTEPMYYMPNSKPVQHSKDWQIYLPKGASWFDFWTGIRYEGGQTTTVSAPLDIMPIFVKAGSIIPAAENLQYAAQIPEQPVKLVIYPGKDASFTLYEDEGDTYAFEDGQYSMIPLTWKDATGTLTIGARIGSYKGMEISRQFEIHLASFDNKVLTVDYDGTEQTVVIRK
ncbi:MAG: glycoside hydrolase family 31 protein [Eubacteriales bacterium]|nr:glycoside hydrolase family 31 protein [Eubacteriales bacterium]